MFTYEDYLMECSWAWRCEKKNGSTGVYDKIQSSNCYYSRNQEKMSMSPIDKKYMGSKLSDWCTLPAIGTLGGILIVWDLMEVQKMDEIMGNYSVSIKLMEVSSGFEWLILGVYGPSRPQHCSEFWNELLSVRT